MRLSWCLLLALAFLGCASRVTLQALQAVNAGATVVDVCIRPPTVESGAEFWAYSYGKSKTVSDLDADALLDFAQTADVLYRYDPNAPSENTSQLPWPYHHMQCARQSARQADTLPDGLSEVQIPLAAREALVSILTQECAVAPAPVSTDKRFIGQVGVPSSLVSRKQFTSAHIEQVTQALRDAIRSEVNQFVRYGPAGPLPEPWQRAVDDYHAHTAPKTNVAPVDTPQAQFAGGFVAGSASGLAPGGIIVTQTLIDSGILPKGTREARAGKAFGEIVVGAGQTFLGTDAAVVGGGMSLTGGGAVVGVPVCIAGISLATNGAITFCNGVKNLAIVLCQWGDEPVPPAPAAPAQPAAAPKPAATPPTKPTTPPAAKPAAKPTAKPAPSTHAPGKTSGQPKRYGSGVKSGKGTTTWVKCTGQMHHAISKGIHVELEKHPLLKGVYKVRDERFVTQAIDKAAHNGYQTWHRKMERQVAAWLQREKLATPTQFEEYLRNLYRTDKELAPRFPNGL